MFRYKLRTLLIVLALMPPTLAVILGFSQSIAIEGNRLRATVIRGLPPGAFLTPSPRPANRQLGNDVESEKLSIEQP